MQSVKFISKNKQEHQFVTSLRKKVHEYFRQNNISPKANAAMVVKSVILINLYLIPFIVLLLVPVSGLAAFSLVTLMGIGIAGIGMGIMHDACHGAYSKKHWVNNMFSGTLYLLGSNVLNWKIQHNVLHHTYTNISGLDEDIDSKGPIRLAEAAPFAWSTYKFVKDGNLFVYQQTLGAAAGKAVAATGWNGSELMAVRLHVPSKIEYHNTRVENFRRGNILVWEQSLTDRLRGVPLAIDARMQTQSILYRTLWLFAATFLAVAVAFAITIWWILSRGKTPAPPAQPVGGA